MLAVSLLCAVTAWHLVRRRRMRAEKAALEAAVRDLREREERFRILVEDQTDMVVKVDPQGRFLHVSPAYCRTFGKSEAELLGQAFMPLVHEEDLPATREAMKGLLVPPHRAYMEQRAMTAEGWRWIAWNDSAIVDRGGGIVEIIGVGRDITSRKQSEELLRQSEERFAKSFHANPAPLVLSDIATGTFIDVNERWVEMLGYPREEQIGRTSRRSASGPTLRSGPGRRRAARKRFLQGFPHRVPDPDGGGPVRPVVGRGRQPPGPGRHAVPAGGRDRQQADRRGLARERKALPVRHRQHPGCLYRTDAAGRLCMISPSGVRLLQYGGAEEMLGRPNDEFWYEPERRQEFLERMRSRGRVTDYEVLLRRGRHPRAGGHVQQLLP
ncbi:hypothetical protein MASR1M66_21410 [Aminivibrio sp.]